MRKTQILKLAILSAFILELGFFMGIQTVSARSASEMLGRGLICLPKYPGVYCSWRLLPTDAPNTPFYVYRNTAPTGTFTLLNQNTPVTSSTNYHDQSAAASANPYYYKVKPVNGGEESWSNLFQSRSAVTAADTTSYIDIPIFDPKTSIHSMIPADLNGDGMLDFVLKTPNWNYCHNVDQQAITKISGMIFENGTWIHKWTINTAGFIECETGQDFSNNPFLAWDLDGDLKSEVIIRRGLLGKDLVVLNGETGVPRASMPWPEHIPLLEGVRDTDGAVIARLRDMNGDGVADPFIIIESGLYWGYQRFTSTYFDGANNELKLIDDLYATKADYRAREGLGTHGFPIADIDLDGKDEFIPCGAAIDDDFSVMWEAFSSQEPIRVNTRHNDTCFTADLIPGNDSPGLETFMGEEDNDTAKGYAMMVDAGGHILWQKQADPILEYDGWTNGWCAELSADYAGTECFNIEKDEQREAFECGGVECLTTHVFSVDGTDITDKLFSASTRGDASAERKSPVDWIKGEGTKEMYFYGNPTGWANSGWYHSIYGDLFGDSREEVMGFNAFLVSDGKGGYKKNNDGSYQMSGAVGFFRISSNTDDSSANYRRVTPLVDRNYRDALARVGVGYRTNYIPEPAGQERTDVVYSTNPPACTNFEYAPEACQSNGKQKLNIVTASPSGCINGSPVLSQSCTYVPPSPGNEVDPKGTYIEAEDFTSTLSGGGAGMFSIESNLPAGYNGKSPGFLGRGYLKSNGAGANPPNSEAKEYLLNFPHPGSYKIWIRGYTKDSDSNTISYGLDGQVIDYVFSNTYYSDNQNVWRWLERRDAWNYSNPIIITQAGLHKINLWVNKPNFLTDGIYITDLSQGGKKPTDLVHGKITQFANPADVNVDGHVNIKDIQLCIKAIVAPDSFTTPDQLNQLAKCQVVALPPDVVNIKDIQGIIRKIVGG